jgi:hypothetical protein
MSQQTCFIIGRIWYGEFFVLFFAIGIMRLSGSFETAWKLKIRS